MGEGTCGVEGEEAWVWASYRACQERVGEQGMVKGLPNDTSTVNISKITTQSGKRSLDFHNDLSVSAVG